MPNTNQKLTINDEFKSFLPAVDQETLDLLEQSIKDKGGATDPIVVWKGKNTIVDGHNRYEICTRLGLPFKVQEREFKDTTAVKLFMLEMQLGRRNLTEMMLKQVRGWYYKMLAKPKEANLKQNQPAGDGKKKGQSGPSETTAKKVADKFGTSERTIKRDAVFTEGIARIKKEKGKKVADGIVTGKIKVNKADIETVGKAKDKAAISKAIDTALAPKKANGTGKPATKKQDKPAPAAKKNDESVKDKAKAATAKYND